MSYYYQPKYHFSYHSLMRIKQRLNSKLNDFELQKYCLKLITEASSSLETSEDLYIQVNGTDLYFVIDKQINLVKTLLPLSAGRIFEILNN